MAKGRSQEQDGGGAPSTQTCKLMVLFNNGFILYCDQGGECREGCGNLQNNRSKGEKMIRPDVLMMIQVAKYVNVQGREKAKGEALGRWSGAFLGTYHKPKQSIS